MKLFSPTKVAVIIAATFFFMVATSAHGQCYSYDVPYYYSAPVYTTPIYSVPYTTPIYSAPRTVLADPEYQNVHYSGTVRTKEYVKACLPSGKRITIPTINGIAPLIDCSYSGNSTVYDLDYNNGERWNGKNPIEYSNGKKQPAPRVSESVETVHEYKGKRIGIKEWPEARTDDRPPVVTESRSKMDDIPAKTPAPSFQDEVKKLQELYDMRQKLKDAEYASTQKLKDQRYQDTIEQLKANIAELKEMVKKMEMEKTPPAVAPPKLEELPMPRPSPGMKKPSEITPKGSE
jgi:hypothetical protein